MIGQGFASEVPGLGCCQAPRRICCGCDSSTAGLESVFSLSQIGGMSADFQTQPVGPAILLSQQWRKRCRPSHFVQNFPLIWTDLLFFYGFCCSFNTPVCLSYIRRWLKVMFLSCKKIIVTLPSTYHRLLSGALNVSTAMIWIISIFL